MRHLISRLLLSMLIAGSAVGVVACGSSNGSATPAVTSDDLVKAKGYARRVFGEFKSRTAMSVGHMIEISMDDRLYGVETSEGAAEAVKQMLLSDTSWWIADAANINPEVLAKFIATYGVITSDAEHPEKTPQQKKMMLATQLEALKQTTDKERAVTVMVKAHLNN